MKRYEIYLKGIYGTSEACIIFADKVLEVNENTITLLDKDNNQVALLNGKSFTFEREERKYIDEIQGVEGSHTIHKIIINRN